jgi:phospholipase/lecithinase/hemolysin
VFLLTYASNSGDSYTATGFSVNSTKPSSANPLGNPAFPGYTSTNGNNWIDDLITTFNSSLLLSYNFAYGGATTSASLVTPYTSSVLSLIDQVSEFSSSLAAKPDYAPWTETDALFAIWMGVNDVGNGWYATNWTSLSQEIISTYFVQVQKLYDAGGRNFVFLSVPPIQYTPMVIAYGNDTVTSVAAGVKRYNQLLMTALEGFMANNTGVKTWLYDTVVPFEQAIADPTAYGSPNATCYNSDGVSCLWYNDYHPGQAIHKLVAEGVATLVGI